MTKKNFKAMIVDQDPALSSGMKTFIQNIFSSIHIQNVSSEVEKYCLTLKPEIIFINLGILQREVSFNFLDKLFPTLDPPPMVFGYAEAKEPELVAHAIENGVLDVFTRPYDEDIIASKINRFIMNEKSLEKDLGYAHLSRPLKAEISFNFKVVSVDENGITFLGEHYLSKGSRFTLSSPFIQELFAQPAIELMVTKTWLGENYTDFLFFAEPREATEMTSASLRKFILSKL